MKDLIIVGAGGWGREVAWTLGRMNALAGAWRIVGFADDDPARRSGALGGVPLVGPVAAAAAKFPSAAFFIAVGDNAARERVVGLLPGREFPAVVDPAAVVAPDAQISRGAFVGPLALVSCGAKVGDFAIVNARAGVGHDCTLGRFSQVCPGASLSGATEVGDFALVGTNAATVPGAKIGARARVAAGTTVFSPLAPGATLSPFGLLRAAGKGARPAQPQI